MPSISTGFSSSHTRRSDDYMKPVRKQSKKAKPSRQPPPGNLKSQYPEFPPKVRFSATIHAPASASPNWMDQVQVDRVPDPQGQVRALLTEADLVRLLDQGYEIRLYQAYPVQPLDPKLIESEDSFQRWLDQQIRKIKRPGKPKGSKDN